MFFEFIRLFKSLIQVVALFFIQHKIIPYLKNIDSYSILIQIYLKEKINYFLNLALSLRRSKFNNPTTKINA